LIDKGLIINQNQLYPAVSCLAKIGLCGLTIFHRLTTFQQLFKAESGQTMKNRQTTARSIVKKVSNKKLLNVHQPKISKQLFPRLHINPPPLHHRLHIVGNFTFKTHFFARARVRETNDFGVQTLSWQRLEVVFDKRFIF
jgi:hypothetical protein